jgi:plasmid stability protein
MANLTITIDDKLLRKARIRAAELGTSVNAVLRQYMEEWTGLEDERRRAIEKFVEASKRSRASSAGRRWTRDELYDRR